MRALILDRPDAGDPRRALLEVAEVPDPLPAEGELLIRVSVCGVCRTDLDILEGRLIAPRYPVIPGHQVIGRVIGGAGTAPHFREGDRVGVAWIHSACGTCRWCRDGNENLCPSFRSTG